MFTKELLQTPWWRGVGLALHLLLTLQKTCGSIMGGNDGPVVQGEIVEMGY